MYSTSTVQVQYRYSTGTVQVQYKVQCRYSTGYSTGTIQGTLEVQYMVQFRYIRWCNLGTLEDAIHVQYMAHDVHTLGTIVDTPCYYLICIAIGPI